MADDSVILGDRDKIQARFENGLLVDLLAPHSSKSLAQISENFGDFKFESSDRRRRANGIHVEDTLIQSGSRISRIVSVIGQVRRPDTGRYLLKMRVKINSKSNEVWRMYCEVKDVAEGKGVKILLSDEIDLTISKAGESLRESVKIQDTAIELHVPAGEHTFDLEFTHGPKPSGVIFLGRREQIFELSVALTAISSTQTPNFLLISKSPCEFIEYRDLFTKLKRGIDALTSAYSRVRAGGTSHLPKDLPQKIAKWRQERESLQETITPYRSWIKRNSSVWRCILQSRPALIINLTEIPLHSLLTMLPDAYIASAIEASGEEPTEQGFLEKHNLSLGIEIDNNLPWTKIIDVGRRSPSETLECLNHILQDIDLLRQETINYRFDNTDDYYIGLHNSLRDGVRIIPSDEAQHPRPVKSCGLESSQARNVVVESKSDAQYLAAVIYARMIDSEILIVDRLPKELGDDLNRIGLELMQIDGKSIGRDGALHLYARLLGGMANKLSNIIPQRVQTALLEGETAWFGSAFPGHLIGALSDTRGSANIAYIPNDADLLLFREVIRNDENHPEYITATIIDSGYFENSEMIDVIEFSETTFDAIFPLEGPVATQIGMAWISHWPSDFIFFNTHGADGVILIGEAPVRSYNIVGLAELPNHPIVFNNSCTSWQGVGDAFIQAGARSYIGTLWPVENGAAADFARAITKHLINGGGTLATAIGSARGDTISDLAYVQIGLPTAKLCTTLGRAYEARVAALSAVMRKLYNSLGGALNTEFQGPYILQEIRKIRMIITTSVEGLEADRRDSVLLEVCLLEALTYVSLLRGNPAIGIEFFEFMNAMYKSFFRERFENNRRIAPTDIDRASLEFRILLVFAQGIVLTGPGRNTISPIDHETVIAAAIWLGEIAGFDLSLCRLSVARSRYQSGKYDEARAIIDNVSEEILHIYDAEARQLYYGTAGQILRFTGDCERALEYHDKGKRLAFDRDDSIGAANFLFDTANTYKVLRNFAQMENVALEAETLCERISWISGRLIARGIRIQSLLERGKLEGTESIIRQTLVSAIRMNDKARAQALASDMAHFLRLTEPRMGEFAAKLRAVLTMIDIAMREKRMEMAEHGAALIVAQATRDEIAEAMCSLLALLSHFNPLAASKAWNGALAGYILLCYNEPDYKLAKGLTDFIDRHPAGGDIGLGIRRNSDNREFDEIVEKASDAILSLLYGGRDEWVSRRSDCATLSNGALDFWGLEELVEKIVQPGPYA